MKLIRTLLSLLLLLENLLLPLALVKAETTEEPIVEIKYTTKDSKTPPSTEYLDQINAAALNGKKYNYYTLTGVVRTIRSDKQTEESGFETGLPVKGYVIVAYDRATPSGTKIFYKDWIAATTTNERGMFALPIEKTGNGVFVLVLKPTKSGYKFLKSYALSSAPNNMLAPIPYNGLCIGAINLDAEEKSIDKLKESGEIPDSVNMLDTTKYWDCGEESEINVQYDDNPRTVEFPITIEDNSFVGKTFSVAGGSPESGNFFNSLDCLLSGGECGLPSKAEIPYKGKEEGRNDSTTSGNEENKASNLSFFNGVLNKNLPLKGASEKYPYCDEFRRSSSILPNANYPDETYQSNGLSALLPPYELETMIEKGEIDIELLKSTTACIERGTGSENTGDNVLASTGETKSYYDIGIVEGNQAVYQNFFRNSNFNKEFSSKAYQKYVTNDSVKNVCPEDNSDPACKTFKKEGATEFPRTDEFSLPAQGLNGTKLASANSRVPNPTANKLGGVYSTALRESSADGLLRVPYSENQESPVFVYEIGPLKDYCEISSVVGENNKPLIKNEYRKKGILEESDPTAAGYIISNQNLSETVPEASWADQNFYDDPIRFSLASFLKGLVTRFTAIFDPQKPADSACAEFNENTDVKNMTDLKTSCDCSDPTEPNKTDSVCAEVIKYGTKAVKEIVQPDKGECRRAKIHYYRYKTGTISEACKGEGTYNLKFEVNPIDDVGETVKVDQEDTPMGNLDTLTKSLSVNAIFEPENNQSQASTYNPISVGQATVDRYQITTGNKTKFFINKNLDSASTDILDCTRFSVNVPNGTEDQEMPYNNALVRLINRDSRRIGGDSFFADTGNSLSNNGISGGPENCSDGGLTSALSGASSKISKDGLSIAQTLEPGFWKYWNKTSMYPQYWNEQRFQSDPNPDFIGDCADCLFWCSAFTNETYKKSGKTIAGGSLWVPTIASWFGYNNGNLSNQDNGDRIFIANTQAGISQQDIKEGDVIFFDTDGSGEAYHIALVYSVQPDYIETLHANAACVRYTFTRNSNGTVQSIDLGDGFVLKLLGFGRMQ